MTRSRRPHLFTPHSDLPASFASDAPPTGRQWLDTAIRFDQSEESNGWILLSDSDQSERSSHARYRWAQDLHFSSFPSVTRTRHHVYLGRNPRSLAKTRLLRLEPRSQVPFLQAATQGYSTVAPPIVNIRPTAAELPSFNTRR